MDDNILAHNIGQIVNTLKKIEEHLGRIADNYPESK